MAGWPRVPRPVRLVGGILALWMAWVAVVQARIGNRTYLDMLGSAVELHTI